MKLNEHDVKVNAIIGVATKREIIDIPAIDPKLIEEALTIFGDYLNKQKVTGDNVRALQISSAETFIGRLKQENWKIDNIPQEFDCDRMITSKLIDELHIELQIDPENESKLQSLNALRLTI